MIDNLALIDYLTYLNTVQCKIVLSTSSFSSTTVQYTFQTEREREQAARHSGER